MKSNPVVFPFKKFSRLKKRPSQDVFVGYAEISFHDLLALISQKRMRNMTPKGKTVEDKLLSLFLHDEIRFGPKNDIASLSSYWKDRFSRFLKAKKPLEFTLLGFPGKAPVPLKTNRRLPDFGEVLALFRLHELTRLIKRIYKPGARITIITEGVLGTHIGLSAKESSAYEREIKRLIRFFKWHDALRTIPLGALKSVSGFSKIHERNKRQTARLWAKKNPEFVKKYRAGYPSILHLINSRHMPYETLQDAYTLRPKTARGRQALSGLKKNAHKASLNYFAFLKTRDDLHFLERSIPGFLALTVSPKRYRLGIHLIDRDCELLAHHGVPVYDRITYLHELLTSKKKYIQIFCKEDRERKPFLYLEVT